MGYTFEQLGEVHRKSVIDIFNDYIANSYAAYPQDIVDYDFFDSFLEAAQGFPAVAVRDDQHEIVGFSFLHAYRAGRTFRHAAEFTCFILPQHTGKGIGRAILEHFRAACAKQGIETLLAQISSRNEGSLKFHMKNGFAECGRFLRIGRKFGQEFDIVWMQLHL